jgi:hypothetical protein
MNHLDALAKLIGAENHIFATTYNPNFVDQQQLWDTIDILRKAVNEVRTEIACMIGATLNYPKAA